jgi:hypothetical protein
MRIAMTSLFVLFTLSSCNFFSPLDSGGSSLEKCKGLADAGDYAAALVQCEAHLEYADASLASLGMNIAQLSDVFLKSSGGTTTITSLAESLLAAQKMTVENTTTSKQHARNAITAFDNYGTLLSAQDPAKGPEVAAFYKTLSRLCLISVIMAYADLNGNQDGEITRTEICNGSNAACLGTAGIPVCVNDPADVLYTTTCEGIDDTDAAEAATALEGIKDALPAFFDSNAALKDAVDSMSSLTIIDPSDMTTKTVDLMAAAYKGDAGREILRQIAR